MALTKVALTNVALGRAQCGKRVVDFDNDTTKEAKSARDIYDLKRDTLLRTHIWNFSKHRVELATVTPDNTLVGFDYAFALPSDWLRTIAVSAVDTDVARVKYKMESVEVSSAYQAVILTNVDTLYLRYVRKVTSVALMDPLFREAFAWAMAEHFALDIRQSTSQAEYCEKQFRRAIATARSTNGIEDWPDEFPVGSWVTERFVEGDNWYGDNWG